MQISLCAGLLFKTVSDTKAKQNESNKLPLSVTIDSPVTIEKSEQDRYAEARDSEHKASNEWWLIVWTAVLASTTLLLAAITGILARYTYKLWRGAKETSERQGGEMKESLRIAAIAAEAAKESAETARKEFLSTHRPRLIVRRVSINIAKGVGLDDVMGVQYVVANVGDTPATIVEMSVRLWLPENGENLPAIPPYGDSTFPGLQVDSGESFPLTHMESAEMAGKFLFLQSFADVRRPVDVPNPPMLFLGYIVYEDFMHRRRRTAFLRSYNFTTRRFDPIDHSDYEYQD